MADGLTVVGVGRSGTSTATAFAEIAGLRLPYDVLPADQWNPDGYLESSNLIHFNDRLLAASGQTWLKPCRTERNSVTEYRCIRRAVKAFKGAFGSSPGWVWKDPRLPMLLPFWDRVLGIQPALVPYRDPVAVAASISRRDKVDLDVALAIWERHTRQMLASVTGRPVLFSDYSQLTERPETWFRQFFDFCVTSGLDVTDAAVDFSARIRRIDRPSILKQPTSQQSELADLVCSLDGPHQEFQPVPLPDESPNTQCLIESVQNPRMTTRIRSTFSMRPKYVLASTGL